MIRAIVVDDERPALNKLARLLEKSMLAEVVGEFTKPVKALEFLSEHKVDVVFWILRCRALVALSWPTAFWICRRMSPLYL